MPRRTSETYQIEHRNTPVILPDFTKEILHQEDDAVEISRATFPDSYEGAAEHLDEDGCCRGGLGLHEPGEPASPE